MKPSRPGSPARVRITNSHDGPSILKDRRAVGIPPSSETGLLEGCEGRGCFPDPHGRALGSAGEVQAKISGDRFSATSSMNDWTRATISSASGTTPSKTNALDQS